MVCAGRVKHRAMPKFAIWNSLRKIDNLSNELSQKLFTIDVIT